MGGGKISKLPRESNLELLRIFAMLAIIAHHSVVNSTVLEYADFLHPKTNDWLLALWGAWGKTAINSFILISGYFLCKGTLTWKRWIKLYIQIQFYSWLIMVIFALAGYEAITLNDITRRLFFPFPGANNGFGSSFMIFYAGVPLYNKVLNGLSKRHHQLLLAVLLGMFTISSTFFGTNTMNEPFWYMALYFVAAYIRLYPCILTESLWIVILGLVLSLGMGILSVVHRINLGMTDNLFTCYHYISDSNKLLAFGIGLTAFLVAKNAPSFHNRIINTFASGCFGVLLIHASSDTMRRWLWQEVVDVPGLYQNDDFTRMATILICVPIVTYALCAIIDILRQKRIEGPLMRCL